MQQQDGCKGGFLKSLVASISQMRKPCSLYAMGFTMKLPVREMVGLTVEHPQIVQEDENAHTMGRLVVSLLAHRLAKFYPSIRGWPERFCLLADADPAVAAHTLREFEKDFQNFEACCETNEPCIPLYPTQAAKASQACKAS